ncbi:MAG TPA: hypothetical protein IAB53_10975 [Candidatus Scybalocola faecipullorum]|nr:hypothetical protein [Candidatus Scybalocola faecipullorum]
MMNENTGDVFSEVLVKRKMVSTNYLIVLATVLGAAVLTLALLLFLPTFIVVAIAIWFGVYFVISIQKVEYEYIFTSGDLDIDQISGNFKRKRKLELTGDSIEIIAPEDSHELDSYRNGQYKVYDFSSRDKSKKRYVIIANISNGRVKVFFEPTEKMIDNMWKYSPRRVKKY